MLTLTMQQRKNKSIYSHITCCMASKPGGRQQEMSTALMNKAQRQHLAMKRNKAHTTGVTHILPEAVSGEPGVELEEALFPEGLHRTVYRALVGVAAIRHLLHLLDASLDKVKGQTACCCTEASNHGTTQYHSLAILGKSGLF